MVFERIQKLICEQFLVEAETVTPETTFVDDLGADSLDVVELTIALAREMLSGRIEDGDKVRVAWSEDEQRVVFEKIVKDTGDDSPDDQAKAGIEEPSEVAENKTDVPKPSVGDEVQSKDDKSAE